MRKVVILFNFSVSGVPLIIIGEFNREQMDGTETSMRVKRVVKHPLYDVTRSGFAHNIALLELETPVKLNDHIRMVSQINIT